MKEIKPSAKCTICDIIFAWGADPAKDAIVTKKDIAKIRCPQCKGQKGIVLTVGKAEVVN